MKIELYTISKLYYKYINAYDGKIEDIMDEKRNRPFVGAIIKINEKDYFAPLTSPKKKHKQMLNLEDFVAIDNGKYGGINLNNMLPVPNFSTDKIIKIQNIKVWKMQKEWIYYNQQEINKKAMNLYEKIITKRAKKKLEIRCCNFELLEKKYDEYVDIFREDSILYKLI